MTRKFIAASLAMSALFGCAAILGLGDPTLAQDGGAETGADGPGMDAIASDVSTTDAGTDALDSADVKDVETSWNDPKLSGNWETFDIGPLSFPKVAGGFADPGFDGRYVYFVANRSNGPNVGTVVRYDTQSGFKQNASWSAFDMTTLDSNATTFAGSVFDGQYMYFVQEPRGTGCSGSGRLVVRYDTKASFSMAASWSVYDLTSVTSGAPFVSGVAFDGRYLYLAPTVVGNGCIASGLVLRYDTMNTFKSPGSWATFDAGALNAALKGFAGATFDGKYVYFVPQNNNNVYEGTVARYDTTQPFQMSGSWSSFDVSSVNGTAKGFMGATFDGRYLYLVPWASGAMSGFGGLVARYDTSSAFAQTGSWSTFDMASVASSAKGFRGGLFDGRFVYFSPSLAYPNLMRYDTTASFGSSPSWTSVDLTPYLGGGVIGLAFDGRHVYFASSELGTVIARFDAKTPASMPSSFHGSFY